MKLIKPAVFAVLRFLGFVAIPLYLVTLVNGAYPDLLPYSYEYFRNIILFVGIPLIILYFLAEALENPKYKLVFHISAITVVLLWTYFILGGGIMHISYQGIRFSLNYYSLLLLILLGIALRYPIPIVKCYLELQK